MGILDQLLSAPDREPEPVSLSQLAVGWKFLRHQLCRLLEGGQPAPGLFADAALETLPSAGPVSLERRDPTVDVEQVVAESGHVLFTIVEREPSELGQLLGFPDRRVRARCRARGSSDWAVLAFPELSYLSVRVDPAPRPRASALAESEA